MSTLLLIILMAKTYGNANLESFFAGVGFVFVLSSCIVYDLCSIGAMIESVRSYRKEHTQ